MSNHWSAWAEYEAAYVERQLRPVAARIGRLDEFGEVCGPMIPIRGGELELRYYDEAVIGDSPSPWFRPMKFEFTTKMTKLAMERLLRALRLPMSIIMRPVPAKAAHKRRYQKRHR